MSSEIVKVETDSGTVELSPSVVRKTISDNPKVTDREVEFFIQLCKAQRLNPFIKEAHLIKYGDNPATMIVGKDVFTKRAQKNPRFKGMQAGVSFSSNGKLGRREGSMLLPGEKVLGGWCKVYVDGYLEPIYDEVSFDEYAARKKDGSLNSQWSSKPGTMIRKVAMVHALREAFPDDFAGLYDEAEMTQAIQEEPRADAKGTLEVVEVEAEVMGCDTMADLWDQAAILKRQAIDLGVKEDGINAWMEAAIRAETGPKAKREYTADDVRSLIAYLEGICKDARERFVASEVPGELEGEEPVQTELYDEDVEF